MHLNHHHLSLLGNVKELNGIKAGDRQDNRWLQYNSSSLPRTQQDWDQCVFVEKTHWGYYCWPRFTFYNAFLSLVLFCYFVVLIYLSVSLIAVKQHLSPGSYLPSSYCSLGN